MEQLKMVRTLPCFTRGAVCRYMTATLMQSYLLDLYIETRRSRSTSMPVTTGVKIETRRSRSTSMPVTTGVKIETGALVRLRCL